MVFWASNEEAAEHGFELKASCGVSAWTAHSGLSLDDVIRQADEAMYSAKRASRQSAGAPTAA